MHENIHLQLYVFLYTFYGGIIIGILYDLIDVMLNGYAVRRRTVADLIFWAIAFCVIIGILFYVNHISFRFYVVVGFAMGWFVYFFTISKLLRRFFVFIKKGFKYFMAKVKKVLSILLTPIMLLNKKKNNVLSFIIKIALKVKNSFTKYKTYPFKDWYVLFFPLICEIMYLPFTKEKAVKWEGRKGKED